MLLNDIFTEAADATYFKDQVRGTEKAKTVKPQPHKGSQPHPFQGRLVGGESVDSNPTDKVTMDIPLFLRMMEYAKEDAKTDMDLHDVTERAIALMKEHEYLCMDNYNDLVGGEATGGEQPANENNKEYFSADQSPAMMKARAMAKEHGVKVQWVLQFIQNGTYIEGKRANNNVGARNRAVANLEKDWDKFSKLYKDFTPDTNAYINATNEEKKGLYYYVNKRKKAGTSRSKDHPKAPSAQDWKNAAKTAKESIDEDFQWTNPNLSQDEHNKVNKLIQQKLKSKAIDVDKLVKDPRPYKDRLPQGKETAPMPVYDRNVPSFMPTSKVKPKQYVSASKDIEQTEEGWLDKVYAAGRNFADTASLGTAKYGRAGIDWAAKNAMHQLGYADQGTSYQKELDQEIEKLDKDWKEEPGASLAGMGAALAIPVAGEYGAAVKGAQGLAGQALDTYSKAVKMYPLAKAALGYKDMKNPKVEDVELEENLLSRIAGLVGAYYGAQMGIPDAIMSTMDMPLGTYELTQHILGGVAGYALGATMGDVAIGSLKALTKRMLRGALNKAIQSIKGGTPQDQAWKNYEAEVKAQYQKIKAAAEQGNKQEPKLFDKTTTEGKIKGVDGKACWPGKRYAGKEKKADGTYKDICVPVKKGK
jgi:hypothetical protein